MRIQYFMADMLVSSDYFLTRIISDIFQRNYYTDILFSFLSMQGIWFAVWLVIITFYIEWEEKKHHYFTLLFFSNFAINTLLVQFVLKNIVARSRPWIIWDLPFYDCPTDFSFPSSHAAIAWSSAYICSHFDKKRKFFYYALAALISLSRVYLYCHFFMDVLAGAVVGIIISKLLLNFTFKKRKNR